MIVGINQVLIDKSRRIRYNDYIIKFKAGEKMLKEFKTTGICIPELNYMVDISGRLDKIVTMVDKGDYFTINRARQYGKTTTLGLLKKRLAMHYDTWGLSFEGLSSASFENEDVFVRDFLADILLPAVEDTDTITAETIKLFLKDTGATRITKLGTLFRKICKLHDRKIVLIIDEVDQACNNKVFIDFLGILRKLYLEQAESGPAFQSVILASVYDIKNMKLKIRPDDEHRYNSPWNIAADFEVDMSFSPSDIASMLREYERDHHFGINIEWFSEEIFAYTSGYPYLVSRICQLLDETVWRSADFGSRQSAWTPSGLLNAIKIILTTKSTLFDDMVKKVTDFPDLKRLIEIMLIQGIEQPANIDNEIIQLGMTFGFLTEQDGKVKVANRIFETRIYNWLISETSLNNMMFKCGDAEKNLFIKNGLLDIDRILERFKIHYDTLYSNRDASFLEREARFLFLTYLKPIINGIGNYYIEAETRDQKRTDIVIDYKGIQYIIELKLWYGQVYRDKGRLQLCEYLEAYGQSKGWLVSFCFSKSKTADADIKEIQFGDKIISEIII